MRWDNDISDSICNIVGEIIASTPVFTLHCKPNQEAALLCHQTISIK